MAEIQVSAEREMAPSLCELAPIDYLECPAWLRLGLH